MNIGLDIDGVLANFPQAVIETAVEMGMADKFPARWQDVDCWYIANGNCAETFNQVWKHIKNDVQFWLKLKPFPYGVPLDFIPTRYVTSRPIDSWVTQQWLDVNRFPKAELITVSQPLDKLEHMDGLDMFIDDHWETVRHLRENGVNAVLYKAPYQRGHDCSGLPIVSHLSEVMQ
jgi:hypothetical protein